MRIRTLPLLLVLPLALAGCSGSPDPTPPAETTSEAPAETPSEAASETPSETPSPTHTGSLPTAPPAKTFPATLRDVGGIRWGGVSPLCGLWAMGRLGNDVTGETAVSAPLMHVGAPEVGYLCVGGDWEEEPGDETNDSYLWLSPENLVGVLASPKAEGSAQVAAVRMVNSNPTYSFLDWSQMSDGSYTTVPGYPAVRVDRGWQPDIAVYTVAYTGPDGGDGYQYFARFFDDPADHGNNRALVFAVTAQPDETTWAAVFGEATSWGVIDLMTSSYRWRKGIDAPAHTPAFATWYDLYTNCGTAEDAAALPCQEAFNAAVLPTLTPAAA